MSDDGGTTTGPPPPGDGEGDGEDGLLAELRGAASRLDPVPPGAVLAARSALAWRSMDAELAELTADSLTGEPAPVRDVEPPALLAFDAPGLTVEVEVLASGGRRRLLGQLVPPQPGRLEVRHRGGRIEVAVDEVGRFAVGGLEPGPVSLRAQAAGRWVETDWFLA